ncbi:NAD-P-binding protein [Multifurca ochricompacta]|uniref:NAD-P-binding protein n=1 Tax=Multifurca ochricompacta TaxID=376703 RepID=A0AAD4M1Q8_9AGAM|nr:NAD-P-binding protein [Multifurca ochricompacta]
MKVIVTGASGVLGNAVFGAFARADAGHTVIGLANSRPGGERDLRKLNLLDSDAVSTFIRDAKPNWVIHCAAERKPDVAEKDPERTRKLNVDVPAHLATLAKELGFTLIYISTDYVFDGTSPPYVPSAQTNPVNLYGITKRDGELAVLGIDGARVAVLRVPVLYGPVPSNADSASGRPKGALLPPVIHYSTEESFTKYEICLIFARILGLPHAHIIPDAGPPPPGSTPRPHNTQLYLRETKDLVAEGGLGTSGFEEWWVEYLGSKTG